MTDTAFYRMLEKASSLLILNFLWMIACLPLITIFPATAAMFSVVRVWHQNDDFQVFGIFWSSFRKHFRSLFQISLIWFVVGGIVVANYLSIPQLPTMVQLASYTVNTLVAFVFLATTAFLFPVVAHFQLSVRLALKLTFVFAMQNLSTSAVCVAAVAVVVLLAIMVPISLLVTGSALAYFVYAMCSRAFPSVSPFQVQP